MAPYQQRVQQPYMADNGVGDPMMRWNGGGDGSEFVDNSGHAVNQFDLVPPQPQYTQSVPTPSNSLARRPMNQALVPTNPRTDYDPSIAPWNDFDDDSNGLLPRNPGVEQDNVEVLEEMAAKAKRESQSKRKQIPPFVQKLSRYVNSGVPSEAASSQTNGVQLSRGAEEHGAHPLVRKGRLIHRPG